MATSYSGTTTRAAWLGRALVYAMFYVLVGVLTANFGGRVALGGLGSARFWRMAAWVISAIAFGSHLQFERLTAARSVVASAWHGAFAAALGAFGMALSANIYAHSIGSRAFYGLLRLALVLWPVATFVAAFLVGLAAATLMRPRLPA
ncbi:MAG TPA: hypothetical protein VJ865_08980 [Gemmatimonadaceae bacterium]|nr:hypothetical protein [Gemmatimonadaceae bacterium]